MSTLYLLDTSVLSALAPGKPPMSSKAAAWFRNHAESFYISAVTLAEIEQGICKLQRMNSLEKAAALTHWLNSLCNDFNNRIITIDADIARKAGALSDYATSIGRNPGFADILIAATARSQDGELLTQNGRHFEPLGVRYSNPFDLV